MKNQIIFIIGVSGSGKTTIGKLLSKKTNLPFFDADDFHPKENIAKMNAGIPLNDTDRTPWLTNLINWQKAKRNQAVLLLPVRH